MILATETLTHSEEILPIDEFIRVPKSYFVRLGHIGSYQTNNLVRKTATLPIGDLYRKHFLDEVSYP